MNLEGYLKPGQEISGSVNSLSVLTISAYGIAVKHGFKGTEEEWLISLEANPERIQYYVNEYLEQNPTTVDTTLTNEGEAADAKATGDAIKTAKAEAIGIINSHTVRTDNPHGVTKAQVGLGNVDNTSDADKPVSTVQAEAIADAKKAGTDAQTLANNAQTSADNAQTAADNAQESANTAQTVAQTAEENAKAYAKAYADGLRKSFTVSLPASGWSASAPYTQAVTVSGILETDEPHWDVVLSSTLDTAIAQKEAFAVVDDLDTAENTVTFRCLEEKPEVDLTIQMEVNR